VSKQIITITIEITEDDIRKARRLGGTLEAIVIEAMGLTGRRGFSIGMGIEAVEEAAR